MAKKEKIPSTPESRAQKLADTQEVRKAFRKTFIPALAVCLSLLLIYSVCYISFFDPEKELAEKGITTVDTNNTGNNGSSSGSAGGSSSGSSVKKHPAGIRHLCFPGSGGGFMRGGSEPDENIADDAGKNRKLYYLGQSVFEGPFKNAGNRLPFGVCL